MPHCNALAAGLKSCANKTKEESMIWCTHCHNGIESVVVILRVVRNADLDGNKIGEYYRDDDPITEIEDIQCPDCGGSLKGIVEE